MIIYRIALIDNIKKGPFSYTELWVDKQDQGPHKNNPTVWEDTGLNQKFNSKYFCGCTSLNQVRKWFSLEEAERLNNIGFCIHVIEVENKKNNVFSSFSQCITKLNDYKTIGQMNILDFFEN